MQASPSVAGQQSNRLAIILALVILVSFFASQFIKARASFVGYGSQLSIFHRTYQDTGVIENNFLPAFNFEGTTPPSDYYLSKPPLTPLIATVLANLFGDQQPVYIATITLINVVMFALMGVFSARWWGWRVGLLVVFFSAWSKYAIRHGDVQTFEQLSILGMIGAIFLYFEWVEKGNPRYLLLSILLYFIGLWSDYLAFFAAFVICLHWLFLVRGKSLKSLLQIGLFPLATVIVVGLMVLWMYGNDLTLQDWIIRAQIRVSESSWLDLIRALVLYPITLFGPGLVLSAGAYLLYLQYRVLRKNEGTIQPKVSSRDLQLLYCLLIAGLLPLIVFKNATIIHRYWIMFLLPFIVVAGSVGVVTLWYATVPKWLKYGALALIGLSFVGVSAQGIWTDFRPTPPEEMEFAEIAHNHLSDVLAEITSDDRMLVLAGISPNDSPRLSARYLYEIPVAYAEAAEWQTALEQGDYTLIFTSDEDSQQVALDQVALEPLFEDGTMALYRVVNED